MDNENLDEVTSKVENIVKMIHNENQVSSIKNKAREKLDWTKSNIRVGAIVTTNTKFHVNVYETNFPLEERKYRITKNVRFFGLEKKSNMMFLGFDYFKYNLDPDMIRLMVDNNLKDVIQIKHKWIIDGKIYLTDFHPEYFDLQQNGSGDTWADDLKNKIDEVNCQIKNLPHLSLSALYLTHEYDYLIDYFTSPGISNPIVVDAYVLQ